MNLRRFWVASMCALVLAACGGGGGGGPSSSAGSEGSATNRGAFTLNTQSVAFATKRNGAIPGTRTIFMHVTGTGVATANAGYKSGLSAPGWLQVAMSGTGSDYFVNFTITTAGLATGNYDTVVTVGTADANGSALQSQDVQVSYSIQDGLVITSARSVVGAVYGSSVVKQTFPFTLQAPATTQWTAASTAAWLVAPAQGQGGGQFNLQINSTGLAVGSYTGALTLTNTADANDTTVWGFQLNVSAPTLSGALPKVELSDASGLSGTTWNLSVTLSTGDNAYPLTVTGTTVSGGGWLVATPASSTVSGTATTVQISADRTQLLAVGSYTGEVTIQVNVLGQQVTSKVPVTYNYDLNRIWVDANGVAFSSFPHRTSVLTRSFVVRSAWDGPGMAWQATSSANWLSVTPSGSTGQLLQLIANPSGLSAGHYYASVTISSPDQRVANQETIRVGLTVEAFDPVSSFTIPVVTDLIATNPVEPTAYVVENSGAAITVIDVNNLITDTPISGVFTQAKAIATSSDGRTLFVVDRSGGSDRVLVIDLGSRAVQATYPLTSQALNPVIVYGRPDSHPVLLSPTTKQAFDLVTGSSRDMDITGSAVAFYPDQSYLIELNTTLSPASTTKWRVRYSHLPNTGILFDQSARNSGNESGYSRGGGRDLAISYLGSEAFIAADAPYQFDVLNAFTLNLQGHLAGAAYPNNAEACWRGFFAGGADAGSNPAGDIWLYDGNDALLAQLDSGSGSLYARALVFSGDCARLISGSSAGLKFQDIP